jgi:N-succinyldiaminopimelate aminotransferase
VQALIKREDAPYIVMPNPFYQIYEGAALLAGAKPYFINCTEENGYLGDFDAVPAEVWEKQHYYLFAHQVIQQVLYFQKNNSKS